MDFWQESYFLRTDIPCSHEAGIFLDGDISAEAALNWNFMTADYYGRNMLVFCTYGKEYTAQALLRWVLAQR
jgi:hypothetical protein